LIELYSLYTGRNNGELFLSVRDAAKRGGMGKNAAQAALADLIDKGFVRPRQKGGFDYKARHATQWVLTEFEYAGALPTKDFMRWQPGKNLFAGPAARTDCPITETDDSEKVIFLPKLSSPQDRFDQNGPKSVPVIGHR
jgi:hypothetical protein